MRFNTLPPPEQQEFASALERDVEFTRHAYDQMLARGIPRPTVLAIIVNGHMAPCQGLERIQYDGYCAVMDENRVVTVYERNR